MGVVVAADVCMWGIIINTKRKTLRKSLFSVSGHVSTAVNLGLTFASLHALKPAVIHVSVAGTSTIIIPSTTRSATTDSPRFLERAAVWTYHHRRGDAWRSE